jgi:hypothetical protein
MNDVNEIELQLIEDINEVTYQLGNLQSRVSKFVPRIVAMKRAAIGAQPATEAAGEPSAVQHLQAAIALVREAANNDDISAVAFARFNNVLLTIEQRTAV